ncbi:molybdopterin-dependent oxidoreductase [Desulfuromonas carbonis]|uniref:molybdopterin-dependent oxidoreductase n=1 Tax=Desulfuromonas sp. DDH964 TaxID=1823759 RepID=UPI00078C9BDD|nr:molybdopterin-dependent oxidoreductase [Desulfuromonas sp. DDH964]AMV71220.1 molybdopterin-binding iron-sulfur cluster-binding oxidoreductase MopB-3 [Desulfuromonas sp. DDH964]
MSSLFDKKLNRRRFLGLSSCALAGVAVGSQVKVLRALAETGQIAPPTAMVTKDVFTSCGMCVNKCGVIARVKDGVIHKLDPNPQFIKSRGMLCARGNSGVKVTYDPDRLKYPLIRVGARGEGKWRRASWEEALDLVVKNMNEIAEKYSRAGMMFASTEGTFQEHFFLQLAECYGSPNTLRHPTLCLSSNLQGFGATYGTSPTPDVLNADYIIMSGANRSEALITPDSIDLLKGDGGKRKLVYLDPRFTKTAAKADEWLAIKPGTDMAFILAMLNVIVFEERYDKSFVAERTVGFDKLLPHIQPYTPEWAEAECDIPAATIRRIAREFAAAAPKAVYYQGRRSSFFANDTQMRRAMAILNAVVGNWDVKGGMVPNRGIKLRSHDYLAPWYDDIPDRLDKGSVAFLSEKDGSWPIFRDRVLEGKPYPVKGMMIYKQNVVSSVPNRAKTLKMMEQMDFICTIDITMSDTAWFSDVVLPEATYLERLDPPEVLSGLVPVVAFRQPAIEPLFESKPNLWIMQQLAKRLGDEVYEQFDFTMEKHIEHMVSHNPQILTDLKKTGVYFIEGEPVYGSTRGQRLKTPSGKVEIYSERYAENGLDPLPVYQAPAAAPGGRYRLVVGRHAYFTHGTTANNPYLHDLMPVNTLWLHPREADRLGLKNGQLVKVRSGVGEEQLPLEVTEKIRPDTVYMAHGFGVLSRGLSNIYGKGGCDAALIEEKTCPISGNVAMHETFVEILPA